MLKLANDHNEQCRRVEILLVSYTETFTAARTVQCNTT